MINFSVDLTRNLGGRQLSFAVGWHVVVGIQRQLEPFDQVTFGRLARDDGRARLSAFEHGLERVQSQFAFGFFRPMTSDAVLLEHGLDDAGEDLELSDLGAFGWSAWRRLLRTPSQERAQWAGRVADQVIGNTSRFSTTERSFPNDSR